MSRARPSARRDDARDGAVTTPARRDYRGQVAEIRRTRLHPRRTDPLYLHLRRLRDDLRTAVANVGGGDVARPRREQRLVRPGPAVDVQDVSIAGEAGDAFERRFLGSAATFAANLLLQATKSDDGGGR